MRPEPFASAVAGFQIVPEFHLVRVGFPAQENLLAADERRKIHQAARTILDENLPPLELGGVRQPAIEFASGQALESVWLVETKCRLPAGAARGASGPPTGTGVQMHWHSLVVMPRQLRIEDPGAISHTMYRGDRREPIFEDAPDRQRSSPPWAKFSPRRTGGCMGIA